MATPPSAVTTATANYQEQLKERLLRYQDRLKAQAFSLGQLKSEEMGRHFAAEIITQLKNNHGQKIEIIKDLASSIIAQAFFDDPQIVISLCDRLLNNLDTSSAKLYLHPDDASMVRVALDKKNWPKISIVEDDSFTRGSIKITTKKYSLDATVPAQINKAIDRLVLEINKHGDLDPI